MTESTEAAYLGLPQNTNDFIERIQASYQDLMKAIEGLTPQQAGIPDEGGWSIKDNLAHLATWEDLTEHVDLQHMPASEYLHIDEQRLKQMNEDEENAVIYERNKERSYEDVLKQFNEVNQRVIKRIREMPFEELMGPPHRGDPQKRPLILWVIGNTYEHFQEHLPRIQAQAGKVRGKR